MENTYKELVAGNILQDRYKIEKRIGKGACSIVYLAYDLILLQNVAVKELILSEHESEFVEEAKTLFGKCESKGFPEVREVFRENGSTYLVMEYIAGKTLKEYVKDFPQKRMKAEILVKMLLPVMEALEFLHGEEKVHLGVCADKLRVRENDECCLIGVGTQWADMLNGKIENKPEWIGPWSDVWQVSKVFYETVGGKVVEKQYLEGHDNLRKLSEFVEIDPQIEQTIMQGLSLSIQQRFFSISVFAERLRGKNAALVIGNNQGRLQAVWGEKWLEITTIENTTEKIVRKRTFGWTKKQKKKAAVLGIGLMAMAGIAAAGFLWYRSQPVSHEKLLKKLEKIEVKQEYGDSYFYEVTKDFVIENHLVSDMLYKFPVKREEMKDWMENFSGEILSDTPTVKWNGGITVYKDVLQMTDVACYETEQYLTSYEGMPVEAEWKYDVTDEFVTSAVFGGDKDVLVKVIEELLPILVPETFLTREEILEYFEKAEEENTGYYRNINHGKYVLSLDAQEHHEDGTWKIYLENYLDLTREEKNEKEKQEVAAGNYVRDSKEYWDFIGFVKDRAVFVEEMDEMITYSLDEAAVKEWGQPSNAFLLEITDDMLLGTLEKQGMEFELVKENEEFTVNVYSGGGIETRFLKGKRYKTSDDTLITIYNDVMSDRISSISIHQEENNLDLIAKTAAKVMELISEDVEKGKTEEAFLYQLENYQKVTSEEGKEHYTLMSSLTDCGYSFLKINDMKHICVFFEHHSFSFEENGYAPYDWS